MAAHLGFHDHDQAIGAGAGVAIEDLARELGKAGGKVLARTTSQSFPCPWYLTKGISLVILTLS